MNKRFIVLCLVLILATSLPIFKVPTVSALDKYQNQVITTDLGGKSQAYLPFVITNWIYVDSASLNSTGEVWINIAEVKTTGAGDVFTFDLYLHQNTTSLCWNLDLGYGTSSKDVALTLDSWTNVTYYDYLDGGNIHTKLYVNNVEQVHEFWTGLTFFLDSYSFGIYATSLSPPDDYVLYFDDYSQTITSTKTDENFESSIYGVSGSPINWTFTDSKFQIARSTDQAHGGSYSVKCPSVASQLYSGFESNFVSFFDPVLTNQAYDLTTNSSYVHIGSYGLYSRTTDGSTIRLEFAYFNASTLFVRFFFKIVPNGTDVPSGAGSSQLCYIELGKGGTPYVDHSLYVITGGAGGRPYFRVQNSGSGNYSSGTHLLTSDTWYQLDLEFEYVGTTLETRFFLNGDSDCQISETFGTWTNLGYQYFIIEGVDWTLGASCETAIDDFYLSTIGFGGGGGTLILSVSSTPFNSSIVWENGSTYTCPQNFTVSSGSHTVTTEPSYRENTSTMYVFDYWTVNGTEVSDSWTLTRDITGDTSIVAVYVAEGIPSIEEGWIRIGIGLIGLILMFLSWFVGYWIHKAGDTAKGGIIWFVMFVIGYGLFTVLLGG
jgi:hypothetical protein